MHIELIKVRNLINIESIFGSRDCNICTYIYSIYLPSLTKTNQLKEL